MNATTIRPLAMEDLDAARAFNERVYAPGCMLFDPDFFHWQVLNSGGRDRGADPGAWAAFDGDAIAAACVVSRYDMTVAGQERLGGWFHYWFADESAAGVGARLALKAMAGLACVAGARITLEAVAALQALVRPLAWFEAERLVSVVDADKAQAFELTGNRYAVNYLRALERVPDPAGAEARPIGRFDDEYDALWRSIAPGFEVATNRDSRFMNWRYVDHPHLSYSRVRCDGGAGPAVFVWRDEETPGGTACRLCEAIGSPQALAAGFPAARRAMAGPKTAFIDFFCAHAGTNTGLAAGGMRPHVTRPDFELASRVRPVEAYASKLLDYYVGFPDGAGDPWAHHGMYLTRGDANQDVPLRSVSGERA